VSFLIMCKELGKEEFKRKEDKTMSIDLPILISFVSITIAVINFISSTKRNNKKDTTEDATQMATVITELKNIMDGISDIKKEITDIRNDVKEDRDRIIRIDESAKQAHKRIDELIKRLEKVEGVKTL